MNIIKKGCQVQLLPMHNTDPEWKESKTKKEGGGGRYTAKLEFDLGDIQSRTR